MMLASAYAAVAISPAENRATSVPAVHEAQSDRIIQ